MQFEGVWVSLTVEQVARLQKAAQRQGRTVDEIVRDAVDAIEDISDERRHRAAAAILSMSAPVEDWDLMKSEIEDSRYPELEGLATPDRD
jgi:Ribbon-helix-helix protein, copG family